MALTEDEHYEMASKVMRPTVLTRIVILLLQMSIRSGEFVSMKGKTHF